MNYNLLDEPWIPVLTSEGVTTEVSLKEALQTSHQIARLDLPWDFMEFSLIRLMLAILYRAYHETRTQDGWQTLYKDSIFPQEPLNNYLNNYHHRFNLIDPQFPFYQIVGAEYEKADSSDSPANLLLNIRTLPNQDSRALFNDAPLKELKTLPFNTAALHLITLQAYRTAARKSTIKGDPRIKKKQYAQPGWDANFTGVLIEGRTLKDTLLLNLLPYDQIPEINPDLDLPLWERPQQTPEPEGLWGPLDESRNPTGPADIYTWQTARITLKTSDDGTQIHGAVIGIGDRLFAKNKQSVEPMSGWKIVKEKATGNLYKQPMKTVTKNTINAGWTQLPALLSMKVLDENSSQGAATRPATLAHLNQLIIDDIVNSPVYRLTTYTGVYGTQDAVIEDTIVSRSQISADLITTPDLVDALETSVEEYRKTRNALNGFYYDAQKVSGFSGKYGELTYPFLPSFQTSMETAFSEMVTALTNENVEEQELLWREQLKKHAYIYVHEVEKTVTYRHIKGIKQDAESKAPKTIFEAKRKLMNILRKEGVL